MSADKIENKICAILVAGTVLLVFTGPVCAKEIETQETDVVDWTGAYLGLNVGLRQGNTKVDYQAFGDFEAVLHHGAVIGGAQFGYNWEFVSAARQWVVGIEGDTDFSNQSMDLIPGPSSPPAAVLRCVLPPPSQQCVIVSRYSQSARSIKRGGDVSTRLRGGFSWRNALIYATGGVSITNTRVTAEDSLTVTETQLADRTQVATVTADAASGADKENLFGWTLGLGGELTIHSNISVAVEFRRSDYGRHTYSFNPVFSGNGAQSLGTPAPTSVAVTDDRVTLRLNYRVH